jgi:cytochrome c oxidase subunit I+III
VTSEPRVREPSPEPSIWPLLAALATTGLFVGSIFTPWAVVWGTGPLAVTLIGWFWPKSRHEERRPAPAKRAAEPAMGTA